MNRSCQEQGWPSPAMVEAGILDYVQQSIGGRYRHFERNVNYSRSCGGPTLEGELDAQGILADGRFDYIEAKARFCSRSEQRAFRQFRRAYRAFGRELRYCYLATPTKIYGPYSRGDVL